jgi:hypothetical protein
VVLVCGGHGGSDLRLDHRGLLPGRQIELSVTRSDREIGFTVAIRKSPPTPDGSTDQASAGESKQGSGYQLLRYHL